MIRRGSSMQGGKGSSHLDGEEVARGRGGCCAPGCQGRDSASLPCVRRAEPSCHRLISYRWRFELLLCRPVDRPLTIALGKDCKRSNKLLHAYPQMSINLREGGGTHTLLSAHCSGPGAAFGLAPSYSRARTRSRWSSRRLRTDVRLLQAALREPFLQDETFAQDQPKKSFFWGPLPKTLHRQYNVFRTLRHVILRNQPDG